MRSLKTLVLLSFLVSLSMPGCKEHKLKDIQDLKGVLESQKDKSTVILNVEGSQFRELYFLRNDGLHPRLLYIKIGNDLQVEKLEKFWKSNNFSTSYFKDNGLFMVRYKNSIDSAVLFSKYYLYDIQKISPEKKVEYQITDDAVIQ